MRVTLSRESVIRLSYVCREAERSVHRALATSWGAFCDYYRGAKTDLLLETVADLSARTANCRIESMPTLHRLYDQTFRSRVWRGLFGRWLAILESRWAFRAEELRACEAALVDLLSMLESPAQPTPDELIAFRMRLNASQHLIHARCKGMPELERAQAADHYDRTPSLRFHTLAEILEGGHARR